MTKPKRESGRAANDTSARGRRGADEENRVFNPLPEGSRDLLAEPYRLRRAVTAQLLACFERWGYSPISTPAVEYFEVFRRGLSEEERERCVRFIEAGSGALVTLRSDITPQIARLVAQRTHDVDSAMRCERFSYAADTVRLPGTSRDGAERHQAGVELIGDGHASADAELIALAWECLRNAGLPRVGLDLASTQVVRSAFERVRIDGLAARRLRALLGRKDAGGLRAELAQVGVRGKAAAALVSLCELHGSCEVIDRARELLAPLKLGAELDRLQEVVDALGRSAPKALADVTIDLGEVRGFDYYSGLRLRVWAPGVSRPLVRGGRYNDLLCRYGVDRPATGFAVDLDALEQALAHVGVETEGAEQSPGRLVAIESDTASDESRAAAQLEARAARSRGRRSWVEAGLSRDAAEEAAEEAGADRFTYFARGRGKTPTKERWRRTARGWGQEGKKRSSDK